MDLIHVRRILLDLGYDAELVKNSEFGILGETLEIRNVNTLRYLIDFKYFDKKMATASALLIDSGMDLKEIQKAYNGGILVCENAKECFFQLNTYLYKNTEFFGSDYISDIHSTVVIGKNVKISDKNVKIGKGVMIEDNVIIHSNVEIGDHTKIYSGAVLGSEGIMVCTIKGKRTIVPHAGKLIIGKNVVIMNGVVIQKGINTAANTIIEDEVIIGSGGLISHGTKVGKETIIIENTQIAGYCNIGNNIWIGGGCVMKNGIQIGDNAHIALGSVIIEDIPKNTEISGFFGVDRYKSLMLREKVKRGKF